jgi:hypothetical protein
LRSGGLPLPQVQKSAALDPLIDDPGVVRRNRPRVPRHRLWQRLGVAD